MVWNTIGIINVIIVFLTAVALVFSFYLLFYRRKRDRLLNELFIENNEMRHYLNSKTSIDSLERSENSLIYFRNRNFDYEGFEHRLIHEISRLRQDMKSLKDLKYNLERSSDDVGTTFDYQEFIFKLSEMTNIQYLFDLLNNEKEEKITHIKNVLSDIVHTIRNPVSGIRAITTTARIDDNLPETFKKIIDDIELCLDQIEKNLNSYFQISHINTFLDDKTEIVNIKSEIENRLQVLMLSSGKKINIDNRIADFALSQKDYAILLLALTCILENSMDFCPDNGTIFVEAQKDGSQIQVIIQNDGPIVAAEVLDRIFRQGFSTRNSTGRGLSLAKRVIEEMLDGIVLCENIGEKFGVRFSILFEEKITNE